MLFRQLFEAESSTFTYLLADDKAPGKPAVLIDPVIETYERDAALIEQLGLTLVYALNTHAHADHVTGTGKLKKRLPGVKSVIAAASGAPADVLVNHGDRIAFGNLYLEVRATPGHTNGCVTYVTGEGGAHPSPRMAFTGDALLIRGCGRTDFQQGNSSALYRGIWTQIFSLPRETAVYPAHDYKGFTSTTVGEEMDYNPRVTKTEEQFIELMANLNLPKPKKIDVALPANFLDGADDAPVAAPPAPQRPLRELKPDLAHDLLKAGGAWVYLDVRTKEEFADGHPPGSVNVPVMLKHGEEMVANPDFVQKVRTLLPNKDASVLVGCRSGARSAKAIGILEDEYPGCINVGEGFNGWSARGLPSEK